MTMTKFIIVSLLWIVQPTRNFSWFRKINLKPLQQIDLSPVYIEGGDLDDQAFNGNCTGQPEKTTIRLNTDKTVHVDGIPCCLTMQEFLLFVELAKAQGRMVTRDKLLATAWGLRRPERRARWMCTCSGCAKAGLVPD